MMTCWKSTVEGEEITEAELLRGIRLATLKNRLVPVLCGTALKNQGVQPLLDAIIDFLPAPADVPPIEGIIPRKDRKEERESKDDAPFAALAFKIARDPNVAKIVYCRIYSGTLKRGDVLYNVTKDIKERATRILQMHANKREPVMKPTQETLLHLLG